MKFLACTMPSQRHIFWPDFFPLTDGYAEKTFWPFILIYKQLLLFYVAQIKTRDKTPRTSDPLWFGSALCECPLLSWPFMWLLRLYWVLNVFSQPLLGQKKGLSPARMTNSVNISLVIALASDIYFSLTEGSKYSYEVSGNSRYKLDKLHVNHLSPKTECRANTACPWQV